MSGNNNISLEIKKDPRAKKFFQKGPRVGSKKTKSIAIRDIAEECGAGKQFTMNYLNVEYILMQTISYDFTYIPL
jgi:hypothetical protein